MGTQSPAATPAERARTLMTRKEHIESEIEAHLSILRLNDSTMKSPLVDSEGFPRGDIDIYAVRNARIRVLELRNDLQGVMDAIANALQDVYQPASSNSEGSLQSNSSENEDNMKPFAKVDAVSPGSPASEAGLLKEDLVVKFGPVVHKDCTSGLHPIAKVVADNENRHVVIKVIRAEKLVFLNLYPKKGWGGRGMLGCHIVPHNT